MVQPVQPQIPTPPQTRDGPGQWHGVAQSSLQAWVWTGPWSLGLLVLRARVLGAEEGPGLGSGDCRPWRVLGSLTHLWSCGASHAQAEREDSLPLPRSRTQWGSGPSVPRSSPPEPQPCGGFQVPPGKGRGRLLAPHPARLVGSVRHPCPQLRLPVPASSRPRPASAHSSARQALLAPFSAGWEFGQRAHDATSSHTAGPVRVCQPAAGLTWLRLLLIWTQRKQGSHLSPQGRGLRLRASKDLGCPGCRP